jgi:hypothetical protein
MRFSYENGSAIFIFYAYISDMRFMWVFYENDSVIFTFYVYTGYEVHVSFL